MPKTKRNEEENPLVELLKPQTQLDNEKNHIYFYTDVDQYTCLELNKKINNLNKELLQYAIEYETEPPNIYLHINSFGGSLFAAFSTIDTIINSKIPIISIIEGCAASAATIISIVCHKRYATANSFMLIHQLSTGVMGKYEELKDDFINDTKLMELLYNLYQKYTKMDLKKIKKQLKRDVWWDSTECLKNGLIDELYTGMKINIKINKEFESNKFNTNNLKRKANLAQSIEASKELNSTALPSKKQKANKKK